MDKVVNNFLLFLMICFIIYLIFSNMSSMEGMTNNESTSANTQTLTSSGNGVAGNAASYVASIKDQTIKLQDMLLITKYRKDYENVVISLDDLVNNLMLKTALSIKKDNPQSALKELISLNESKAALNNVMKFIDSSA